MEPRAAMAVPPQMQVPPPTIVQILLDCLRASLPTRKATLKDRHILKTMSGRARTEATICAKFSVAPTSIMPKARYFLAAKAVPSLKSAWKAGTMLKMIIPINRPKTGAPTYF